MAITDELRHSIESAEQLYGFEYKRLTEIADRIDAAHEEALVRSYFDGVFNDESFASVDEWLGQHEDEMAGHGWVKSPVDDDGSIWRRGDLAQNKNFPSLSPKVVCGTGVINDKPVLFYVSHSTFHENGHSSEHHTGWDYVDSVRHYRNPTVEDVLHDFICDVEEDVRDEREIIAEYAAKLQLRGEV